MYENYIEISDYKEMLHIHVVKALAQIHAFFLNKHKFMHFFLNNDI